MHTAMLPSTTSAGHCCSGVGRASASAARVACSKQLQQQRRGAALATAAVSTGSRTPLATNSDLDPPTPSTSYAPTPSPAATSAPLPSNALTRQSSTTQALAIAVTAALSTYVVSDHDVSTAAPRLAVLTYMLWAGGEWVIHKYFMHARAGSFGDRATPLNKLHVDHHADTHKDMTMKEGFSVDALYFHYPTTLGLGTLSAAILAGLGAVLDLGFPPSWAVAASVVAAAFHHTAWNSYHMDMHRVPGEYQDGLPALENPTAPALLRPYAQWVYNNHTTHHDCGGSANYNVVLPGPDFVFNTYLHRSKEVKL